jgi:hypothetical protein
MCKCRFPCSSQRSWASSELWLADRQRAHFSPCFDQSRRDEGVIRADLGIHICLFLFGEVHYGIKNIDSDSGHLSVPISGLPLWTGCLWASVLTSLSFGSIYSNVTINNRSGSRACERISMANKVLKFSSLSTCYVDVKVLFSPQTLTKN